MIRKNLTSVFFFFLLIFVLNENLSGYLFEYAGLFNSEEHNIIYKRLSAIEKQTSVQIGIYTVLSIKNKTLEDYSLKLAREIGLGQKGVNNGILILIVRKNEKIRIENGFRIEWILSDKESEKILKAIISDFQKGEYFKGIMKGIDLIEQRISKYDWKINPLNLEDLKNLNGDFKNNIVCFDYTNKTGKYRYKYPIPADDQFDKGFKIDLIIDEDNKATLYYTKYMGEFANKILTKKNIKIYSRVRNISPIELELLGIL